MLRKEEKKVDEKLTRQEGMNNEKIHNLQDKQIYIGEEKGRNGSRN